MNWNSYQDAYLPENIRHPRCYFHDVDKRLCLRLQRHRRLKLLTHSRQILHRVFQRYFSVINITTKGNTEHTLTTLTPYKYYLPLSNLHCTVSRKSSKSESAYQNL